ncbi:hypothetical protein [Thorsellia kenyensis]|uniref:Uncharacterized protein n=1 Tax=Thorsellia kenyensis TaxID=1549888 RepID=A0ABV6CCS5_9GAMM
MKQKMKKKVLLTSILSVLMVNSVLAKEHTHVVDKTIKGYYPSFDSVGTRIISSTTEKLRVGDIIAIPSDIDDDKFFKLNDKDGDPALKPGDGKKYDVAWWRVIPKEGYKWADDIDSGLTPVSSWDHVNATLINESAYVDIPEVSTSKALRIPPVKTGERIAFSITPETNYGDPARGLALYAPDLNFFWGNTDENQTPGNPPGGGDNPQNPNPPGGGGEGNGENPGGGGGDIGTSEVGEAVVNIYIDRNGNGLVDYGIDELLIGHPTVNTTYVADIKIVTEKDGEPVLRDLLEEEKESIKWHITNGDTVVTYVNGDEYDRVSSTYAFSTQTSNENADDKLRALPDHFSEQGTTISVSFSFNTDVIPE